MRSLLEQQVSGGSTRAVVRSQAIGRDQGSGQRGHGCEQDGGRLCRDRRQDARGRRVGVTQETVNFCARTVDMFAGANPLLRDDKLWEKLTCNPGETAWTALIHGTQTADDYVEHHLISDIPGMARGPDRQVSVRHAGHPDRRGARPAGARAQPAHAPSRR